MSLPILPDSDAELSADLIAGRQDALVQNREVHGKIALLRRLQRLLPGDPDRDAEDPGGDQREGDGGELVLLCQLAGSHIAGAEELPLAPVPAVPDGPRCCQGTTKNSPVRLPADAF